MKSFGEGLLLLVNLLEVNVLHALPGGGPAIVVVHQHPLQQIKGLRDRQMLVFGRHVAPQRPLLVLAEHVLIGHVQIHVVLLHVGV